MGALSNYVYSDSQKHNKGRAMDGEQILAAHRTPLIGRAMSTLVPRKPLLSQARRLALAPAKVVELGAAHMGVAEDLDLFDARGMERKGTLHADAMGSDATHSKVGVGTPTPANAHDGPAHQLDALPFPLDDTKVDLDVIANSEIGQIRLETQVIFQLLFFY